MRRSPNIRTIDGSTAFAVVYGLFFSVSATRSCHPNNLSCDMEGLRQSLVDLTGEGIEVNILGAQHQAAVGPAGIVKVAETFAIVRQDRSAVKRLRQAAAGALHIAHYGSAPPSVLRPKLGKPPERQGPPGPPDGEREAFRGRSPNRRHGKTLLSPQASNHNRV